MYFPDERRSVTVSVTTISSLVPSVFRDGSTLNLRSSLCPPFNLSYGLSPLRHFPLLTTLQH